VLEPYRDLVTAHSDKTYLDLLRVIHFLASAYLVITLIRGRTGWMLHPAFKPLMMCGQQALPTFLLGIILATLGGMAFDIIGTGFWPQVAVNLAAAAVMIANAYLVAFFKSKPWNRPVAAPAASGAPAAAAGGPAAAPLPALGVVGQD
jgi:hypothetical protein